MQIERDDRFKHIIYIDMDNVLVDFKSGLDKISTEIRARHESLDDDSEKSE